VEASLTVDATRLRSGRKIL